jgi:hypothetical protein
MLEFRDFCRELLNWNGSMFNTECTVEDDSIEEQIFNDISRLLHERVIKPFLGTRGRHRCPTVNTSCCVFFSIGSSDKATPDKCTMRNASSCILRTESRQGLLNAGCHCFDCRIIESMSPINLFANDLDLSSSLSIPNARSQHCLASSNECITCDCSVRLFPNSFPSASTSKAKLTHDDPKLGRYLTANLNDSFACKRSCVLTSVVTSESFPCIAYIAPKLACTSA